MRSEIHESFCLKTCIGTCKGGSLLSAAPAGRYKGRYLDHLDAFTPADVQTLPVGICNAWFCRTMLGPIHLEDFNQA